MEWSCRLFKQRFNENYYFEVEEKLGKSLTRCNGKLIEIKRTTGESQRKTPSLGGSFEQH